MPQNRILCCYTQDAQKVPLISNNTVWLCIENLASEAPILKDQRQRRVSTPTLMKLPCRIKGWMTTHIWCAILPQAHGTLFLLFYSKEWKQMKDNKSKEFVNPTGRLPNTCCTSEVLHIVQQWLKQSIQTILGVSCLSMNSPGMGRKKKKSILLLLLLAPLLKKSVQIHSVLDISPLKNISNNFKFFSYAVLMPLFILCMQDTIRNRLRWRLIQF